MQKSSARLLPVLGLFIVTALAQVVAPPKKIIFIGDSITRGEGYNFRYHIWNKLLDSGYTGIDFVGTAQGNYHGGFDEDFRATGGYTSADMLKASKADIANFKPDIAVIHAGSMDVSSAIASGASIPAAAIVCRDNVQAMITDLRAANPNVKIILAKFSLEARYALACRQVSDTLAQLAIRVSTPASPITTVDLVSGFDYDQFGDAFDKNHLNNSGAIKVSDRLYPILASWLSRGAPRIRSTPKEGPNLAREASVIATASRSLTDPALAIDGNLFTAWKAATFVSGGTVALPTTDWLELDLGRLVNLKGSAIYWDINGRPFGYTIQTRATITSPWRLSVDAGKNTNYAESMRGQINYFDAPETRFVRLSITNLANAGSWTLWPAQILEFRVFDDTASSTSALKRSTMPRKSPQNFGSVRKGSLHFRFNGQSLPDSHW